MVLFQYRRSLRLPECADDCLIRHGTLDQTHADPRMRQCSERDEATTMPSTLTFHSGR